MQTLGSIFKSKRTEKKLTIEDVEKSTKIRKKYIQAIEEGDYDNLPPAAFTRGFIKNYSDYLGLNSATLSALYRREFDELKDKRLLPKGMSTFSGENFFRITPTKVTIVLLAVIALGFIGYLFSQYNNLAGAPPLIILKPSENAVLTAKEIEVLGKTDVDAVVKINEQVVNNNNGSFSQILQLSDGINTIVISSVARNGKVSKVERHVRVVE